MNIFHRLESNVRSYCRNYPNIFRTAHGSIIEDEEGIQYLDFLSGAGTLNYGHNNPLLKAALMAYLEEDGIVHGLDLATVAKRRLLEQFERHILKPRGLDYRIQFPGPTGTNAVEAAMKIARNATGRENIVAFSKGFHGVTLGALAATSNSHYRGASGVPASGVTFMPGDGYLGEDIDTAAYLDRCLADAGSGLDHPAAVLVETIQGEGGVNVASAEWLRALEQVCRKHEVLLIVDDIQMGCGRTGRFFSFEEAGIKPDIVTLSKSLSGLGLPFALTLMKPVLDQWEPGQHNGTFRGHNLAFVTAAAAIEHYWHDDRFAAEVRRKGRRLRERLDDLAAEFDPDALSVRGRGMIQGIDLRDGGRARAVSRLAFTRNLIIETSGSDGEVVKCLSPLTISDEELERGIDILADCIRVVMADARRADEVAV